MATGAGDASQPIIPPVSYYIDNTQLFVLQLSLAVIHQLENEPFVTKLKQVCKPEFAQYLGEVNPRNLTRYMNLTKVADFIAREAGDVSEFKGFDYWRKRLLEVGLATRQVEKGGGWTGFGGVHSHYTFTDIGFAFFNLQACLLVKPSIAQDLFKQASSLDTRGLTYLAAEIILMKRKQVNSQTPFADIKNGAQQNLMYGIFYYLGLLLQKKKEISKEDLWSRVDFYFEGQMRREDFDECLSFLKDYIRSGTTIKSTKEGEALFFILGEFLATAKSHQKTTEEINHDKEEKDKQQQEEDDIWKDGWKDWNLK